jgi:uncharacterized protein (TIRG00374 family)
MKRRLLIGLVISSAFLVLALKDVEWHQLWQSLKLTRWRYLVPTILLTMLGHFFRAYRWRFMLIPVKPIGTMSLFSATSIGMAANNLLPARLGELVRAHVVGQTEGISRTASFATIVYERIVDVFSLLVLMWIMLLKISGPPWLRSAGAWILAVNVLLLLLIIALERYPRPIMQLIATLARPLPVHAQAVIDRWAAGFISGLTGVGRPSTFLPIAMTSALVWGCALMGIYYCLLALGIELPFLASVTLIVIVSLGSMIPSAPAYVGTMQYACIVALGLFNVSKSDALAFSLVYHATQFFPITALGLYYMARSHIRLGDLSKRA